MRCFATKPENATTNKKIRRQQPPYFFGRGDKIRTCGLYVPNVALYQTEPHLVIFLFIEPLFDAFSGFCPSSKNYYTMQKPVCQGLFSEMCKYFKKKTLLPRCGNGALASKIVKGLGAVKIEVVVHHVAVEHAVKGTLHLVLTFPRYAYRIGQQAINADQHAALV